MKRKDKKHLLLENPVLKACVRCTFWHHIAQNPASTSQRHDIRSKFGIDEYSNMI